MWIYLLGKQYSLLSLHLGILMGSKRINFTANPRYLANTLCGLIPCVASSQDISCVVTCLQASWRQILHANFF